MATTKPKPAGPANKGLKIVSRPATFMRCGRQFSGHPTVIALADLSADEVDRLKAEPQLVVTEVDITEVDITKD